MSRHDTMVATGAGEAPPPSVFVISITPFDADGSFDEPAFRAHLRRMAAAGVGVYVGGGGSGEGYTLSDAEATRVLEVAVDEIGSDVSVRGMGVEPRTAGQMVAYARRAAAAGVDATQIYSLDLGHGHRPRTGEVEAYFADVLEATGIPCVLSTHQSVGYRIPVETIAGLAERFPHLVGVNCSHADVGYLARLRDALPSHLTVHVGGPHQALTALALGAQGFLSSEANLAPRLCRAVIDRHDAGDHAGTMAMFATVARLSSLLYGHGGIRATKAVLDTLGLPGGVVRPPQFPADDAAVTDILTSLDRWGVAGIEGW